MTVAFGATGAGVSGTNDAPSIGMPAGVSVGDLLLLVAAWANSTNTPPSADPAGWTRVGNATGGSGAWGSGTGPRGFTVWYRVADGTETTVTVTNDGGSATARSIRARVDSWTGTLGAWVAPVMVSGADANADTSFSATAGSDPGAVTGDFIFQAAVLATTAAPTFSGYAPSYPGATLTSTTMTSATASSGNGVRLMDRRWQITAGPSTGAPGMSATLSAGAGGFSAFVRLRDTTATSPMTPKTQAVSWDTYAAITKTQAVAWDTYATMAPKTQAISWDVYAAMVPKAQAISWDILATMAPKTQAVSWSVLQALTKTSAVSWDVLQAIAPKTAQVLWDVASGSGLTAITPKTQAVSWDVSARITKTQAVSWDVRAALTKTQAVAWNVYAGITKTQAISWDTQAIAPLAPSQRAMDMRVKAYTPNGASLGLLPAPDSFDFAIPLDDIPSLRLDYGVKGPRSEVLGQPLELAVEVTQDGGQTWTEPDDARFLYLTDGRDPLRTADTWQAEARGIIWRLSKARILAEGGLNAEGRREFTAVTVGYLLAQLFSEAQTRGALSGLTLQGGSTVDANGTAWGSAYTISRTYDVGTDYLQVLLDLSAAGYVDFRTSGRTVKVYVPDTAMATDLTVGTNQVKLPPTQGTEAPFRRTWEGLADFIQVAGDEGSSVSLTNPTALKPWGRWEDFITQGGVSDTGTLTAVGQRYQGLTAAARAEFTRGLVMAGDGASFPLVDFRAGDYIWARDLDGTQSRYRVRQVTLQKDGNQVQGNVVLNDRFLEEEVRIRRAMDAVTGTASQAGSTGGTPTPTLPGADILPPAAPSTAPALTSLAYLDEAGEVQSQITVDWPDVSTNMDGTPIADLKGYEVQVVRGTPGSSTWLELTAVEGASVVTSSPYAPGSQWSFRVRAVDTSGNASAWSSSNTIVTAVDNTGPVAPSAPTLASRIGVIEYAWDGKSSTGSAMDADFGYVEVHASQVSGFTPTKGNPATIQERFDGASYGVMGTPDYGAAWYFKLLPVDRSGNAGTPSAQATITPQLITTTDITPSSITTPLLQVGAVTAEKISVGGRPTSVIPNSNMEDQWVNADGSTLSRPAVWFARYATGTTPVFAFETASPISGNRSLKLTMGSTSVITMGANTPHQPVSGGELWFTRVRFRVSRNLPAGKKVYLRLHSATQAAGDPYSFPTGSTWQQIGTTQDLVAGTVYTLQNTWTVPAGHALANISIGNDSVGDGSSWDLIVDNLEAYPATTDDQITTVGANKITTGTLQANQRIVAGALAGARAEMNAAGFAAYRSDGVTTFQVTGADGVARIGGTTGTRVEMSVKPNVYQAGVDWPVIDLFTQGPSWGPARLFASYDGTDPSGVFPGTLWITSPYLTDYFDAAVLEMVGRSDGTSKVRLQADEVTVGGNTMYLGSTSGDFDFNLYNTSACRFRGPLAGNYIKLNLGVAGFNRIGSWDSTDQIQGLQIWTNQLKIMQTGGDDLSFMKSSDSLRMMAVTSDNPVGLHWGISTMRVTNYSATGYIAIQASAFNVSSDAKHKTRKARVRGALDALKTLAVYDYDTPNGAPLKESEGVGKKGQKFRQRGVIAQDLQAVVPHAVMDDDVDGGGLSVDLYGLLSTAVAAIQELEAEVATLKARH